MSSRARQCTVRGPVDICRAMQITAIEAAKAGFEEDQIVLLQLATEEACANACEYAQAGNDPVFVTWREHEGSFMITVRQTGHPFPLEVPQWTGVNTSARGRGLLLILYLMDEVRQLRRHPYVYLRMAKSMRRTARGGNADG